MINVNIRDWLQLFRAQTAPAVILLVMVPYLHARSLWTAEALILGIFALLIHWVSFGHNSLMDYAMGYDQGDPSKSHHPLLTGTISPQQAHGVIHRGFAIITVLGAIFTILVAKQPVISLFCLLVWLSFAHAYNDGLSKESIFGFMPISICFTAMGAWAWFLSHDSLGGIGVALLGFTFFTIFFQIAWSGHLKDIGVKERGNLLIRLGACLSPKDTPGAVYLGKKFIPGKAASFGFGVKTFNIAFGWSLFLLVPFSWPLALWTIGMSIVIVCYLRDLIRERVYVRSTELFNMSIMEVATIFFPIPILLGAIEGLVLMAFGMAYFFGMNLWLWRATHPQV